MSSRTAFVVKLSTTVENKFIEVKVTYDEGRKASYCGERVFQRGYYLSVWPITSERGFSRYELGGNLSGERVLIEETKRFNQKRMDQLASVAQTTELYRRVVDFILNRSGWQLASAQVAA